MVLAIVLLTSGVWSLYTMGSKPYTVTKRYDPAVGLDLELGGCDLDFVPGDEPTIRYRAVAGGARSRRHLVHEEPADRWQKQLHGSQRETVEGIYSLPRQSGLSHLELRRY